MQQYLALLERVLHEGDEKNGSYGTARCRYSDTRCVLT